MINLLGTLLIGSYSLFHTIPICPIHDKEGKANTYIYRMVDMEYGIVCYVTCEKYGAFAGISPTISCIKIDLKDARLEK